MSFNIFIQMELYFQQNESLFFLTSWLIIDSVEECEAQVLLVLPPI
jgi:hypothetical protein